MGKITIQDLASAIVERWHIGKKEASIFVNELFFVIQKSLDEKKANKKNSATEKSVDKTIEKIVEKEEGDLVDDTELVAVISAAIAAYEGNTSADGFVVRSIRKSQSKKWQNAQY